MFSPVVECVVEKIKSTEMVLLQPEVGPLLNALRLFSQNKDLAQVTSQHVHITTSLPSPIVSGAVVQSCVNAKPWLNFNPLS